MFEIRPLEGDDYNDCTDLLAGSEYYSHVRVRDILGSPMFGVFSKGTLVGCAMVLVGGPQAYLDYLFIHPLYQREGMGVKLLRYLEADLRGRGVKKVHACISSENGTMMRMTVKMFKHTVGWPYTNVVVDLEEDNG